MNNRGPIKKWFWAAYRSYTQQGYNFGMFETRELNEKAYKWFSAIQVSCGVGLP